MSVECDRIEEAIAEAKEFIKRAEKHRTNILQGNRWMLGDRASMRRKSMDLTKSLAALRQTKQYE